LIKMQILQCQQVAKPSGSANDIIADLVAVGHM